MGLPFRLLVSLLPMASVLTASNVAHANAADSRVWTDLGCQAISLRREAAAVRFAGDGQHFDALRAYAREGSLETLALDVVYSGGEPEHIAMQGALAHAEHSEELALRGWERSIEHIELRYAPVFGSPGVQTVVCMQGLAPEAQHSAYYWPPGVGAGATELLGCRTVSLFATDRDSIFVGFWEGRFEAIRLVVWGADIYLFDLTVIYANGEPDDIPVRSLLFEGQRTRWLGLRGWQRAIQRVDLVYRTVPNFKGYAHVCVEGLYGQSWAW